MRWCPCNKWLHLGKNEQWVILFDEWLNWFHLDGITIHPNRLTIRSWSLFRITWDNGAWWALDFDNALILDGIKNGYLRCFSEVTIFGIGIRRYYKQKAKFDEEGFKESLNPKQD